MFRASWFLNGPRPCFWQESGKKTQTFKKPKKKMVGAVRFELTTSCTRNKRATRLRYAPNQGQEKVPRVHMNCNLEFCAREFKQKETKETKRNRSGNGLWP